MFLNLHLSLDPVRPAPPRVTELPGWRVRPSRKPVASFVVMGLVRNNNFYNGNNDDNDKNNDVD